MIDKNTIATSGSQWETRPPDFNQCAQTDAPTYLEMYILSTVHSGTKHCWATIAHKRHAVDYYSLTLLPPPSQINMAKNYKALFSRNHTSCS